MSSHHGTTFGRFIDNGNRRKVHRSWIHHIVKCKGDILVRRVGANGKRASIAAERTDGHTELCDRSAAVGGTPTCRKSGKQAGCGKNFA